MIKQEHIETKSRRDREREQRRGEMIAAARTIFARIGYAQTKLEDVADLAEFGKGTLYNYFPNKEALFASVLEETFRGFNRIFEETLGTDLSFGEKIQTCTERSLRHAFSNPEGISLMVRESHYLRDSNPLMELHPQLVELLADTIAAEQERDARMIRHDPMQIAMLLMNMVMGQFINRLHLCFHNVSQAEKGNEEADVAREVFRTMKGIDLENEIAMASDLVCSIFFNGIYNRGSAE